MNIHQPLLTIIVPAYNVEKYISQCLRSLVNQTRVNHKVIVVNDGSTDEFTASICQEYEQLYPDMITYISQENRGLGAARNVGLALVDTPYVGFLDSDDWLPPNYIEQIMEEWETYASESIDMIFTLPVNYDMKRGVLEDWHDKELFLQIFFTENKIIYPSEDSRLYYLEPSSCRRIYRLEFLKQINFTFPTNTKWEDILPHFYTIMNARKCLGIKKTGFYYRINSGNQITTSSDSGRLDIVTVFKSVIDLATREEVNIEVMNAIINMMNRYAKWCLDEASPAVRIELVKRLHILYRTIPKKYIKQYTRVRKHYKKERLFIWTLRNRNFYRVHNDYFVTELCLDALHSVRRLLCFR